MARIAATRALKDACIPFSEINQACVGYCYGDSTCGQRAIYELGMTGIPVYNVRVCYVRTCRWVLHGRAWA